MARKQSLDASGEACGTDEVSRVCNSGEAGEESRVRRTFGTQRDDGKLEVMACGVAPTLARKTLVEVGERQREPRMTLREGSRLPGALRARVLLRRRFDR